jgi:Transposase IS116/IS110/IS902 family
MCPGNDESAGKRRLGKTRKGSKWLSQTLVECAKSANRSKNTYLAAQYARLRARRGANKATIAVCHSIPTAAWHMLQTGETYSDPGGDFFARRDPDAPANASSPSSNDSATPSPCRRSARQPEPDVLYSSSDRQASRRSSRQIRRHCDLGGVPELARLLEINDVSSERRERNGDDHRRSAT